MPDERVELEIVGRVKGTGQYIKTAKALDLLAKSARGAQKGTTAAATSLNQLVKTADRMGFTLVSKTAPAVRRVTDELKRNAAAARAAGISMHQVNKGFAVSQAGASAFTRAATRGVAAIGFISPTAATASAQLVGLTNASAGMTLAIGAGAVGAIALGTALVASTKAAIDFETSFRGIRKTVQGTEKQFAQLEKQNRQLARSLGENVNTINQIGQTAGQLGIAVGQIAQFEKTVVKMAAATDLTANAAATAFGGFMAVLKLTAKDVDRLAAEIVDLGNTYAGTESEISGLLNRIAGAGAVLKMPAADLAAIAAAFSHVRVEQEAAGTAIQKVFLALQRAAVVGGEELQNFSTMLGIATQEFQRMARTDPTEVFIRFVEALGKSGEEAQLWLKQLGLTDQRLTRTFLKMAASGDVLRGSVEQGNEAYKEGIAHTEEFEKALGTTAGQMRLARAAITDIGISVGTMLLPALKELAQVVVLAADGMQILGNATGSLQDGLDTLGVSVADLIPHLTTVQGTLKLLSGDVSGLKDLTGGLANNFSDIASAASDFGDIIGGDVGALDDFGKSAANALDPTGGLIGKAFDSIRRSSGEAGDAMEEMSQDATSAASELGGELGALTGDINEVGDAAADARKKLFAMFSEPTVEEVKAKLALSALRQELLALQTAQRPLSKAEEDRVDVLKKQLIPAAQRLTEQERLYSTILSQQYQLLESNLRSREELADAAARQAREINAAAAAAINEAHAITTVASTLGGLPPITDIIRGAPGAVSNVQEVLDKLADLNAEREPVVRVKAETDEALTAMQNVLNWMERIAGREIAFRIKPIFDLALPTVRQDQIRRNLDLLREVDREMMRLISDLPSADEVFPDWQAEQDAAEKAKKAVDPLADGIISLAEAMEFGFTITTAASAEWRHEQGELANRLWRIAVETSKINRFYSSAASIRQRALIELGEAEVEARKETIELRVQLTKLFLAIQKSSTIAQDATLILFEGQVAFAKSVQRTNAEVAALNMILGSMGLAGQAVIFRHALVGVGEEFRRAGETMVGFLHRLARAALDATRERFDALFARPTRDQAQLNLALAEEQRRRLLRIQAGATDEQLEAIDAEIERIQNAIAIRRAEEDIMRARADIADATLLTEQEQMAQAQLLIGIIARQSETTKILADWLALETLAVQANVGALTDFRDALVGARDAIAAGGGQPRGYMLPAGRPAANIAVNVNLDPELADLRESILNTVHRELDDQLRAAGFGGANVTTGTFVPG